MTAKLYAAMAKAFPDIEGASKDSNNPHFRSKYADLGSVVDAIKPALGKNDLWFRQVNHRADGGVCVETFICHSSGEEVSCGELFVPASKNDAQGYGSALTYARRYGLMAAFGVAPEDDDGNAAAVNPPARQEAAKPISQPQWAKIVQLIEATGTNTDKMLKHYRVDDLKKMTDAMARDCINILEDTLASKAKKETAKTLADELGDDLGGFDQ